MKKIRSYNIFTRRGRGKRSKREPLKRDPCYWATRHTALWPTDRLYSHTILPPAPPTSLSLSLSRSHSSSRSQSSSLCNGLSVPFQHADLPSPRYEERGPSLLPSLTGDYTAIQWIPFPRLSFGMIERVALTLSPFVTFYITVTRS